MYQVQLVLSTQGSAAVEALMEDGPVTLTFCRNGLLLSGESWAAFFDADDHTLYKIPAPATYRLPHGTTLLFGDCGCVIEVDPQLERMRSLPLGIVPPGECEPVAVHQVAAPVSVPRPASDRTLRVLAYIGENIQPRIEVPAIISLRSIGIEPSDTRRQKNAGSEALRRVARSCSSQRIVATLTTSPETGAHLRVGGLSAGTAPPLSAEAGEWTAEISAATIAQFFRVSPGGVGILGIVPPLGDFPEIWYLRAHSHARFTIVL